MGIKPIALSFKNTPDDLALYKWIISHSNMSGFLKDTLRSVMNKENNFQKSELSSNGNKNSLVDLDF